MGKRKKIYKTGNRIVVYLNEADIDLIEFFNKSKSPSAEIKKAIRRNISRIRKIENQNEQVTETQIPSINNTIKSEKENADDMEILPINIEKQNLKNYQSTEYISQKESNKIDLPKETNLDKETNKENIKKENKQPPSKNFKMKKLTNNVEIKENSKSLDEIFDFS